jgi:hypothetical protein
MAQRQTASGWKVSWYATSFDPHPQPRLKATVLWNGLLDESGRPAASVGAGEDEWSTIACADRPSPSAPVHDVIASSHGSSPLPELSASRSSHRSRLPVLWCSSRRRISPRDPRPVSLVAFSAPRGRRCTRRGRRATGLWRRQSGCENTGRRRSDNIAPPWHPPIQTRRRLLKTV